VTDALESSGGRHRQRVMNLKPEVDLKFRLVNRAVMSARESRRAIGGYLFVVISLTIIIVSAAIAVGEVLSRLSA
jgi:hypothetical protein